MEANLLKTTLRSAITGDSQAAERLLALVYDDLRATAGRYMHHERADHTLAPTALVHEAYLRLLDHERVKWQNPSHFKAVAAMAMRRILVNHARDRRTLKRGGNCCRITLDDAMADFEERSLDLLALDDALQRLERHSPRHARTVELRFFAGLEVEEVAELLDTSPRSVYRSWSFARTWLRRELCTDSEIDAGREIESPRDSKAGRNDEAGRDNEPGREPEADRDTDGNREIDGGMRGSAG